MTVQLHITSYNRSNNNKYNVKLIKYRIKLHEKSFRVGGEVETNFIGKNTIFNRIEFIFDIGFKVIFLWGTI